MGIQQQPARFPTEQLHFLKSILRRNFELKFRDKVSLFGSWPELHMTGSYYILKVLLDGWNEILNTLGSSASSQMSATSLIPGK